MNQANSNTIAIQRAKLDTYNALKAEGLPIPFDLRTEVEYSKERDTIAANRCSKCNCESDAKEIDLPEILRTFVREAKNFL